MFLIDVFLFFENLSRYSASANKYAMPKRYCAFGEGLASFSEKPIHACECRVEQSPRRLLNALKLDAALQPGFNIEQRLMNELKACACRLV